MNRKHLSFFFSFIFMLCIITPSILHVVDANKNIYVIVDVTEEESKENEMAKDVEIKFLDISNFSSSYFNSSVYNSHSFYLNLRSMYSGENTSPPPEWV